jgi:hypothetical protein
MEINQASFVKPEPLEQEGAESEEGEQEEEEKKVDSSVSLETSFKEFYIETKRQTL